MNELLLVSLTYIKCDVGLSLRPRREIRKMEGYDEWERHWSKDYEKGKRWILDLESGISNWKQKA